MKMPSPSGFREIDHTADWAIEAWAPDLEGLIRQVAAGMYALMGVEVSLEPMVTHSVALSAEDQESLLVAFLTELLYLAETRAVACEVVELHCSNTALNASLVARSIDRIRRQVKAVTYHNLAIKTTPEGVSVIVVFDA